MRWNGEGLVASCLVLLASHSVKLTALAAFFRAKSHADPSAVGLAQLSARDAFPKPELTRMRRLYQLGGELRRDGHICAYRVINSGTNVPVLLVREEKRGLWVRCENS